VPDLRELRAAGIARAGPPALDRMPRRGNPRGALYECVSYVRVFTHAPHVPDRFRRRVRGSP